MNKLILSCLLCLLTFSIRMDFFLQPYVEQCFYEYFYHDTKYRFWLEPEHDANFEFNLKFVNNTSDEVSKKILMSSVHIKSQDQNSPINLHKFASEEGLHAFCARNNDASPMRLHFKLESGIELMQLDYLPGANDTEILDSELKLLEDEFKVILDSLTSIEASKAMTQEVFQLMSGKTLGFGVIGMIVIILINLVFYRMIKKILQDRKRI